MRDILFRGKCIDTEKWVYGVPANSTYYDEQTGYTVFSCIITGVEHNPTTGFISPPNKFFVEVDPETIGQFTGFKDKNGNKIFEGQTVEEIVEDKVEESGFFVIKSKVAFAYGCWVVCEIGFDYSESEFEDFTLLNDCAYCVSVLVDQ